MANEIVEFLSVYQYVFVTQPKLLQFDFVKNFDYIRLTVDIDPYKSPSLKVGCNLINFVNGKNIRNNRIAKILKI